VVKAVDRVVLWKKRGEGQGYSIGIIRLAHAERGKEGEKLIARSGKNA